MGDYDFETTSLGFGTAGMFHEPSRVKRAELLKTAVEVGILHFDVAPIYGLGLAEGEVGRAFGRQREGVVIATKFGIGLTPLGHAMGRLQGPIRTALRKSPRMQERARGSAASPASGPLGGLLYRNTFDRRAAQKSLEQSLRHLGTHIDLLLLHDPEPAQIVGNEIRDFLDGALRQGTIRTWGVAGEVGQLDSVAPLLHDPLPVAQFRDDIFRDRRAALTNDASYRITFGTLGVALATVVNYLNASEGRVREWSTAIDADCGDTTVVAELLLKDSLRSNERGTVLYSTTRPERLRKAAAVALGDAVAPDPSLDRFRELVRSRIALESSNEDHS